MDIHPVLFLILVLLQAMISDARSSNSRCVASSCGDIRNISHPFRLKSDPEGCGDRIKELACEDNRTVMYFHDGRFYVQSINYSSNEIILIDDGLQKDNCSSLPRHSWAMYNFNNYSDPNRQYDVYYPYRIVAIVNCSKSVSSPLYISTGPCIEGSYSSNKSSNWNLYALVNPDASDVRDFCNISKWMWIDHFADGVRINNSSYNYEQIHSIMTDGFGLYFGQLSLKRTFFCYFDFYGYFFFYLLKIFYSNRFDMNMGGQVCGSKYYNGGVLDDIAFWTATDFIVLLVLFCVAKLIIEMPFVAIFLIYKYRRRHLAMDKNVEEFLQAHNNFLPIRYSYSNIKKITSNFNHKLGEGGYGSVYKGTLRSGNEVAIKILKQSKVHGQDFISKVATIGRIHHVNVVQLFGFCFEGTKQALVYDFMSNGSLDKHIFTEEGDKFLDYKKIYEIALGVAKGIEYLHRGCDTQIYWILDLRTYFY